MEHIKSMTLPEIGALLKELGQPAFRGKQLYSWLHKGVRSYDEMTNLPASLRQILAQRYPICPPEVVRKQESQRMAPSNICGGCRTATVWKRF